jgi:CRP-like cAMP-binding protein
MNTGAMVRAGGGGEIATILSDLKPKFLDGLNADEVKSIVAVAGRKRFGARCVITREGDPAERIYMMLDGGARYFTLSPKGKKIVVRWIRAGELIGGATLVSTPERYILSAEAAKNSSALVWDRATIRSLAAGCPRLLDNAILVGYDFLLHWRILHVAVSSQSAEERVAWVLGYLAKEMGERVPGGVALAVRNEELAHEANVTIFTVSRLMGEWQRKGLLSKSRGKVVLRLPEDFIRLEA